MSENDEIIDAETGEISRAPMAVIGKPQQSFSETRMAVAGVRQLSKLSEDEFQERLKTMKLGKDRMKSVQRSLLDNGTDYGVIPNTKKNTLFKSGAEKLAEFFQFATSYEITRTVGDGVTTPTIHYTVKCFVHLGSADGPVIHAGAGTANSWETKYRYRNSSRKCPLCGKESIRQTKGNDRYPPGYWCAPSGGGCNANFKLEDPAIKDQATGKIENPDPYDMDNTFVKMAKKRAYIDGIIGATATSELFTQDIGDTGHGDHGDTPPASHGDPPNFDEQGFDHQGEMPTPRDANSNRPPAAATKPPPSSGDKRADAMLDAFKKSTSVKSLEKLGEVISKWPDDLKAKVKEPYKLRHTELVAVAATGAEG